jgi:hypothetical protein
VIIPENPDYPYPTYSSCSQPGKIEILSLTIEFGAYLKLYCGYFQLYRLDIQEGGTLECSDLNLVDIELHGSWINRGTFLPGLSQVHILGDSEIKGDTRFNTLSIGYQVAEWEETIYFEEGSTQEIINLLTITGHENRNLLLRSRNAGEKWFLDNSSDYSIENVDVQDSTASEDYPIAAVQSRSSGNNENWIFLDYNEWTGEYSSDWFDSANWVNDIPTSTQHVVIPPNTTHHVRIIKKEHDRAICNALTIASGAFVEISTVNGTGPRLVVGTSENPGFIDIRGQLDCEANGATHIDLSGVWREVTGIFNPGENVLQITGDSTIYGNNIFNDIWCTLETDSNEDLNIYFESGKNQTCRSITLHGDWTTPKHYINLLKDQSGPEYEKWSIDINPGCNQHVEYCRIQKSSAIDPLEACHSTLA